MLQTSAVINYAFSLARSAARKLAVSVRSLSVAYLAAVDDTKLDIASVIFFLCVVLLAYPVDVPMVAFLQNS